MSRHSALLLRQEHLPSESHANCVSRSRRLTHAHHTHATSTPQAFIKLRSSWLERLLNCRTPSPRPPPPSTTTESITLFASRASLAIFHSQSSIPACYCEMEDSVTHPTQTQISRLGLPTPYASLCGSNTPAQRPCLLHALFSRITDRSISFDEGYYSSLLLIPQSTLFLLLHPTLLLTTPCVVLI